MSQFSLDPLFGELEVNHRCSPGLTPEQARGAGYGGQLELLGEGKVARYKSLHCCHCGGCWIENPTRVRARNYCPKCPQWKDYLCDACAAVSKESDYVHRTAADLREMICSGKWRFAGGTASKPVLLPVIGDQNG